MRRPEQMTLPFNGAPAMQAPSPCVPCARGDAPAPQPVAVENLHVLAPAGAVDGALAAPSTGAMVLSGVGAAIGAYHMARRHRGSVGWGILGGALGAMFPIIVPAIALAQGIGEPLPKDDEDEP